MTEAEILAMMARMEERMIRESLPKEKCFAEEHAVETWQKDDVTFYICESRLAEEKRRMRADPRPEVRDILNGSLNLTGDYCGYARFPKPLLAPGMKGIATYVPVHGGITLFQEYTDGSVMYGFDCGHLVSSEMVEILNDRAWLRAECESMARGLRIAARFEPFYLRAGESNEKKARVLNHMQKFLPVEIGGNTGVMLNLLMGEL